MSQAMAMFVPFTCVKCGNETFGKNKFLEYEDTDRNKVIKVCEKCGNVLDDPDWLSEG